MRGWSFLGLTPEQVEAVKHYMHTGDASKMKEPPTVIVTEENYKSRWQGSWPANCNGCESDLATQSFFVDALVQRGYRRGHWGLFCPDCADNLGCTFGTGFGQKYDSKTLVKLEG